MDAAANMAANKFEFLNSFVSQRLLAVAGEIFQVVKDTINEYQEEIERTTQENHYLKKMLTEKCTSNGADNETSPAVPQELTNFNQESLDSVIQVKVELSTMHQDAESQGPLNNPSSSSSPSAVTAYQEPSYHFSENTTNKEEVADDDLHNSGVTVKLEPWDSQVIYSDDAPSAMQNEIIANNNFEGMRDDQGTSYSQCQVTLESMSHAEPRLQSQTVERVVYCEYCGKPFGNREQLKQHLVVHQKEKPRPYRCDLCEKSYSYAQVLEIHRRTHTGERPYHCRFCGRRFNQQSHLKYHERIHTGERPFGCSLCGKRFIQRSQVKKHNCKRQVILQ
ncbi:hypothetical protein SRHO_G00269750 [Serrasalmus rhombeus]